MSKATGQREPALARIVGIFSGWHFTPKGSLPSRSRVATMGQYTLTACGTVRTEWREVEPILGRAPPARKKDDGLFTPRSLAGKKTYHKP